MVLAGPEHLYFSMEPDREAEHTYLHETFHWWQTAMTGYGHASWSIFRQITSFSVTQWIKATASNPNERVFSLKALTTPPTRENVELLVTRLACETSIGIANARFRRAPGQETLDAVDPMKFRGRQWSLAPKVKLEGLDRYLDGIDVIEAQAHFVASQFSQVFRGAPAENFMPQGLSEKYWFAFVWFCKTAGERFAHLFPMVCDLALMTIWNDMPTTEDEWRATCPAWRFVTITNSLQAAIGAPPNPKNMPEVYLDIADRLLSLCNYPSLDNVIAGSLAREAWRSPVMELEKRMLNAMKFRQTHPWCVAYPWIADNVFEAMHRQFPVPILQVEGILKANSYVPAINDKTVDFMAEVGGELMLQAWAMQLLEIPPATVAPPDTIQCGFRYFDIENVCPHQIADGCPGWFKPGDKSPYPADLSDEDTLLGCPFEKLLAGAGVNIQSLRLPNRENQSNEPQ